MVLLFLPETNYFNYCIKSVTAKNPGGIFINTTTYVKFKCPFCLPNQELEQELEQVITDISDLNYIRLISHLKERHKVLTITHIEEQVALKRVKLEYMLRVDL